MALTQALVDEFVAAEKLVPRPRSIVWRREAIDLLRWDAQTEVEDVTRGRVWLSFNTAKGNYSFNLQLQGTPVLGWHFRPFPGRHRNFKCGDDFPASVGYPHEQVWIEGRGFHCARPLEGVDGMSHEEHLRAFCNRARVEFQPTYTPPTLAEQTVMQFGDDE